MDTDKLLKYFAHVANVSDNQTKELFKLCDNNFEKLMEMEAKRKKHSVFYAPSDEESLNNVLSLIL